MDLRSPAFKRGLLLIGSTLAGLALVEGAARAYLAIAPPMSLVHGWELAAPPPPFRGAPHFTDEFISEARAIHTGPESFSGRYLNVVDGRRATTHTPASAEHRVLLFGGSTMFSAEVPDSETIASHLQRLLNRHASYEVSNHGLVALTTRDATERLLEETDIEPGDVVVFYGGVNGVSRYVYSAGTGNWLVDRFRAALLRTRPFSAAARLATDLGTRRTPIAVRDEAQLSRNVARMVADYEQTLLQAAAYVRARGGRFYHFLQPHLFSKDEWSDYEQELLRSHRDVPVGLDVAFRRAYLPLREMLRQLAKKGVPNFDLTDAFDDLPAGTEVYFDFCHVNHVANEIVAGRIYDAIWTAGASGL